MSLGIANIASAQSPLDARVTIDYRNTPAEGVISTLARAAGMPLRITGPLQPVTIALTQVKLSNVMNALCDTAQCTWTFDDGTLYVTPKPGGRVDALPPSLSLAITGGTVREVFLAIGDALSVPVVLDLRLQGIDRDELNLHFVNAATDGVLTTLCADRCTWTFVNGTLMFGAKGATSR